MRLDFIAKINQRLNMDRTDLLEKDLIIHQLLYDLSFDRFVTGNLLFKGGSCLIKHYLGYFRFSEDIDFTWRTQGIFQDRSRSQIRHRLSKTISEIGAVLQGISGKRQLDFNCDKGNRHYVEVGGGGESAHLKFGSTQKCGKKEHS